MGPVGARAVIAHRKPSEPTRGQKALSHDLVEIAQHFGARLQFEHSLVEARLILGPATQLSRIHAVKC